MATYGKYPKFVFQLSVTDSEARPEGVPLLVGRSVATAVALLIWGGSSCNNPAKTYHQFSIFLSKRLKYGLPRTGRLTRFPYQVLPEIKEIFGKDQKIALPLETPGGIQDTIFVSQHAAALAISPRRTEVSKEMGHSSVEIT